VVLRTDRALDCLQAVAEQVPQIDLRRRRHRP
jgi:hypothetical protein